MSLGLEIFVILNVLNIPLHLVGDFLLQTNAMAKYKSNSDRYCLAHAISYGSAYLGLMLIVTGFWVGVLGTLVIAIAHFAVDRYSLAKQVPRLRGDLPVPFWVEKVTDAALHIHCNVLVFLAAAWAVA